MEWLKISTSVSMLRIETDEITYVQAQGNYCYIHLRDGRERKVTMKLHQLDEKLATLSDNHFVRVGKSLIVNTHYIYIIDLTDELLVLQSTRMNESKFLRPSREALKALKEMLEHEDDNKKGGAK